MKTRNNQVIMNRRKRNGFLAMTITLLFMATVAATVLYVMLYVKN